MYSPDRAHRLNACGQLGLPGRGSRVRAPTRLDLTMPDGCRAIEVLCGPNFSCVLDTAGNVTTFGSDSPRGEIDNGLWFFISESAACRAIGTAG